MRLGRCPDSASGRSPGAATAAPNARDCSQARLTLLCVLALGRRRWLISPTSRSRPSLRLSGPDPGKVRLGERLFRDPRLSRGNASACAACHVLDKGGDDGRAQSIGAEGRPLAFNTPTVFNAAWNFRLNWRGNFRTLEEHNEAVLLKEIADGHDVGGTAAEAPRRSALSGDASPTSMAPVRTARTSSTRWRRSSGRWRPRTRASTATSAANRQAITADEERGYQLFKAYGCIACHQGVNVGGNLFQKFGIFSNPFAGQAAVAKADLGPLRHHRRTKATATCSASRACATSRSRRPISTTAAQHRSAKRWRSWRRPSSAGIWRSATSS